MNIEDFGEIKIITDFEEKEYNLKSIGFDNLFFVIEKEDIYFYSDITDFYYSLNGTQINKILSSDSNIIIQNEEDIFNFNKEQTMIIKDILNEWLIGNIQK